MRQKHLNFIPPELRPKFTLPQEAIPAALVLLLVFYAGGSMLTMGISSYLQQKKLALLETESAEITKKLQQSKIVERNAEEMSELQKVLSRKSYWSETFKELSILIPDELWLTSFTNKKSGTEEQLILKGESASPEAVAEFLSLLEESQNFASARINFSEKEKNVKPSRYRFEFAVPLKKQKENQT